MCYNFFFLWLEIKLFYKKYIFSNFISIHKEIFVYLVEIIITLLFFLVKIIYLYFFPFRILRLLCLFISFIIYCRRLIFLNNIKALRAEKNINQDVLADLLGLEVAGISKLETRASASKG